MSAPPDTAVGLQRKSNEDEKRPGGCTGKGWRPGQSGNPSGKRKGCVSLTAALKRELTPTNAAKIAAKLLRMARGGNLQAIKLVFERLDGADLELRLSQLEEAVYQIGRT